MEPGEGVSKTFKIPISYLDYDHIEKCTNVLELEKIYLTLKAGEEGKYPDLENFCEERLKKLSPESRVLRKSTELISINQLENSVKEEIIDDFQSWVNEIQQLDKSLKQAKPSENGDHDLYSNIPIRSKQEISISKIEESKDLKSSSKSCKPKDYNEWSKIANELEKQMIAEEKEEISKPVAVEPKVPKKEPKDLKGLLTTLDTKNMTRIEKEKLAILEKEKGNEAFKSGDLSEAVVYYTRSLSVEPIATVYNNRGLVYMKQKKWDEAIRDLSITLKKEPTNIKALQRRATCYSEIHNLPDAINDCRKVLKLSPNNKFAENLLSTSQEELEKRIQPKLKDGKRMVITEIGSEDESSDEEEIKDAIEDKFIKSSQEHKTNEEQNEVKRVQQNLPSDSTVSNNEESPEAFMKLKDYGNQLFKELKYEEALAIYDKLVEDWPSNPIGYRNRAACNLVLERATAVIEDCSTAIGLDKNSHLSYYRRGKAYKLLKMYGKSCTDLEIALKISPNHNQIKEELLEVKALLEEENMSQICVLSADEMNDESEKYYDTELSIQTAENNIAEEMVCINILDDQENINQDTSNTWEFLSQSELTDCPESSPQVDSTASDIVILPTSVKAMTKYEFDKQLNNIRVKAHWRSTIQLLVDAGPANLSSLIGSKLDGFVLENIISSLLEYSKNKEQVSFTKTILQQLAKVERFCFIKMMISDDSVEKLDKLFHYLRTFNDDLAEIDCLKHQY